MRLMFVMCMLWTMPCLAQDQGVITLDDTVKGNQEQPKVLYIVPWQDAEDDEIGHAPMQTRVKHIFDHVDLDEHTRSIEFKRRIKQEN